MKRGSTAESSAPRSARVQRREAIVARAADLFAVKGFSAVGVHEIGAKVGIVGGAIYRHFASKDELLHAVLLETIDAWLTAAEIGSDCADPNMPIREVVERSMQLVVERPGQLATYVRESHRADRPIRSILHRREGELFQRWSGAILAARPGLGRAEISLRQQAVNGVLGSLALRPTALAQPQFRSLVCEGLLALLIAPEGAAIAEEVRPTRAWTPPVTRRQQILRVAMERFRRRGYSGVGMDEIGGAAGMSGPAIYEYFDSKADILLDAYDRAGALVLAGATAVLGTANSGSEALEGLIRSLVEIAFAHVDLIAVTTREGASLPSAERPRLMRRRRDLHETWVGVLRELRPHLGLIDARSLVRSALALIAQIALHQRAASPSVAQATAAARAFLMGS